MLFENIKEIKRNSITSDLKRAAHIARNPVNEILIISRKFQNTYYPERLINRVIKGFHEKASESDDYSIPPSLFEVVKKVVLMI